MLGLLEERPRHGYELRKSFDGRLAGQRPLRSGQVYSTLGRLERDGRVDEIGGEQGPGPERRLYAITEDGSPSSSGGRLHDSYRRIVRAACSPEGLSIQLLRVSLAPTGDGPFRPEP